MPFILFVTLFFSLRGFSDDNLFAHEEVIQMDYSCVSKSDFADLSIGIRLPPVGTWPAASFAAIFEYGRPRLLLTQFSSNNTLKIGERPKPEFSFDNGSEGFGKITLMVDKTWTVSIKWSLIMSWPHPDQRDITYNCHPVLLQEDNPLHLYGNLGSNSYGHKSN